MIMWELKGCPYCKETHFVNFARGDISDYIKANFEVLQLNIIGSRKVTDFDGTELSEKELAAKYGVRFTPTFQFFGERAAPLKALTPAKARSRARARLSAARRFSRHVPLRAGKGLREQELPGFRQIAAELKSKSTDRRGCGTHILFCEYDLNRRRLAAMVAAGRDDVRPRNENPGGSQMRQLSRRAALAFGAGGAALTIVGWSEGASAAAKEAADEIAKFTGGKTADKGKVRSNCPRSRKTATPCRCRSPSTRR